MNRNIWEMDRKLFENIFVILSLIFILGCVIFYGIRLVKYYKIFNPRSVTGEKVEFLSTTVRKDNPVISEGNGLYSSNGDFVFKGDKLNNYVEFSDQIWRILRVNRDGTIKLILDEPLIDMAYDKDSKNYQNADIYKYINDVNNLKINKNDLEPMTICLDKIDEVSKITCNETLKEQFVALPNISDYINSVANSSFINNTDNMWLSSTSSNGDAWNIDNGIVTVDDSAKEYAVKVVVLLKNTAYSTTGSGSKEKPYIIEEGVSNA